jgi:hypothetical protein
MNVKIKEFISKVELNVGDIVDTGDNIYILMVVHDNNMNEENALYELRSLNGRTGSCGRNSIEEMRSFVKRNNFVVYSSSDFYLLLTRK